VLITCPQWVGWRYEVRHRKRTKIPKDPNTGRNAKSDDAATWSTFDAARAACQRHRWDGVGYVFSALDPFAGVDLDKCRDPATGLLEPWAIEIVETLDSYTEVSPSETGLKIFIGRCLTGVDSTSSIARPNS